MITAHAGSDGYPANSLAFVKAMIDAEVDAMEIDVQMSPDNTLYLSHDLSRNWQDLPTLIQVYECLAQSNNHHVILNVDCKDVRVGPQALSLAKDYQVYDQVVLSGAIDLAPFNNQDRQHIFYNLENRLDVRDGALTEAAFSKVLQEIAKDGIIMVQSYYRIMNQPILDEIHQAGLKISLWTIDDLEEIDRYLAMGADNITTNKALAYRRKG